MAGDGGNGCGSAEMVVVTEEMDATTVVEEMDVVVETAAED
jgi:hypothetical protein